MQNNNTPFQKPAEKPKEEVKKVEVVVADSPNKSWAIVGLTALALVLIVMLSVRGAKNSNKEVAADDCVKGAKVSKVTGKPCPVKTATPPVTPVTPLTPATALVAIDSDPYATVLSQYEGKSVLFQGACVASTQNLSVDAGSRVLVANNSTVALDLAIGNKKATLQPYHYMTSVLRTVGEVKVSCGGIDRATVTVK